MAASFVQPDGSWQLTLPEFDSAYDPRGRPFYTKAKSAGRLVWLQPYIFYDQGVPGISVAAPLMDQMGLKIGFGTDLLGNLHVHQTREFTLRREVQTAAAILRSATSINAELLVEPALGRIAPGCEADILIVDGDPLEDIGVLAKDGRGIRAIMKAGRFHKRDA